MTQNPDRQPETRNESWLKASPFSITSLPAIDRSARMNALDVLRPIYNNN
jgi:hypothetical protein